VNSRRFTQYLAYKRRNTYSPDVWFAAFHQALTAAGAPPKKFVPIRGPDDEARYDADTDAADAAMHD
jgi:hypothetical protein